MEEQYLDGSCLFLLFSPAGKYVGPIKSFVSADFTFGSKWRIVCEGMGQEGHPRILPEVAVKHGVGYWMSCWNSSCSSWLLKIGGT